MSIWISKIENGKRNRVLQIGKENWDLPELFRLFEHWLLSEELDLDASVEWIVDIGFSPREGANGGGPIISQKIMKACISNNISIYLSEYNDRE